MRPWSPFDTTRVCDTCGVEKPLEVKHFKREGHRYGPWEPDCRRCSTNATQRARMERDWVNQRYLQLAMIARTAGMQEPTRVGVEAAFSRPACAYCHLPNDGSRRMHLDHVIPLSRGGGHEASNLTLACPQCNRAKAALSADEYRTWLRGAAERVMAAAARPADRTADRLAA